MAFAEVSAWERIAQIVKVEEPTTVSAIAHFCAPDFSLPVVDRIVCEMLASGALKRCWQEPHPMRRVEHIVYGLDGGFISLADGAL